MVRHIICFGNPLHGDDGFGPAVHRRLALLPLPGGLRLTDAGAPGLAALALFENCHEAIIVDALAPRGAPGRLSQPAPESIAYEASAPGHGVGVGYLLRALAATFERAPRIKIVAVEASAITPFRPGLSKPVAKAVEEAVTLLSAYFGSNSHG